VELVSVLPGVQPFVVSRFCKFSSSGEVTIQQTATLTRRYGLLGIIQAICGTPPRGLPAVRRGDTMLLTYSVHFKSNRGELQADFAKRAEAAKQLLASAAEMEWLYSKGANVVTIMLVSSTRI
jgi:hypothetical protein